MREQHGAARLKNRRHSHRQRLGRDLIDVSSEKRRVAAAGFRPQPHAMRARIEHGARFVEADMAVGADAEDLDVDAASLGDGPFIAKALLVRIGGADEKVDPPRVEVGVAEEVLLHEPAVRAGDVRVQADELVEVEGRRLGPVETSRRCQS